MNKRTFIAVIMLVVFAAGAALALWPREHGPPERRGFGPQAAPVEVAEVVRAPLAKDLRTIGTVEPWTETTLAAEIAGPVETVHVEEGQRVAQGDILVSLGTNDAVLDLARAKAAVQKARADRNTTKADHGRAVRLHTEGAISDSEFSRWALAYERAQADYTEAQALLALAEDQLDKTRIKAPFAGAVTTLDVEIGEWVPKGGAVLTLTATDRLKVRTAVEERDLPFVHAGQSVTITVDAIRGRDFDGAVLQVIPRAAEQSRTFPVLVSVPNTDHALKPGMFARVAFAERDGVDVILAPADAVTMTEAGEVMFTVAPDPKTPPGETPHYIATRHAIRIGVRLGERVEITDGVQPGDLVVVTGSEQLQDGDAVRVVAGLPAQPASSAGAADDGA